MKRLGKIAAAGLIALASLVAGNSSALAQTVLKVGHISPKASAEGVAVDRFAALVKEKTSGAVVIEVFPSEQLGPATAMIESTILGNQDLYVGGNVEFERFSPGLKALGLNYAVDSQDQFRRILKSPLWKEIFVDPLDKAGLSVIASDWERGPFRVLVSTKPVKSFDDLKGLKLRIAPIDTWRKSWTALGTQVVVLPWNDVYLDQRVDPVMRGGCFADDLKGLKLRIAPIDTWRKSWTALGTQVVVLPWNDVYLGLQQGLIEGVTAPANLLAGWGVLAVLGNKRKLASLKPEHRQALIDAADQAGKEYMRASEAEIERDFATMKAKGMQYTVLDLKPGSARMRPVILELEKEGFIPAGIYDRIRAVK
jgi:TRAP-type C4-dicarboxylate transport system substrate-binding protein